MSLLGTASRRFLTRHPGQLALTVLGVALGVAVVVAIDLAIQSSRTAFRVSTETVAGRATHRIVGAGGDLPDSVFRHLRVELGVRESAPVVEGWARSSAFPGRAIRVLGVDPFSEAPFRDHLGEGELDLGRFLAEPNTVLLPAPMADARPADPATGTPARSAIVPGDTLDLGIGGRVLTVVVGGVLVGEDALRSASAGLLLTDVSTAQRFFDLDGRLGYVDLILPEGDAGADLESRIRGALPPGARLERAGARADRLAGMLSAFDLNLTALSLLALVFGMFLIYNAMTFSVVQRRELLGGLRTLGVTRGEIVRMVAGEAAWMAGAGTALGLAGGVVLGRGLVRLVTRTINDLYFVLSVDGLVVPPSVLVKGAILGFGATLLATIPAVLEAVGAPPRASRTRSIVEDRVRRLVPRAAMAGGVLGLAGAVALAVPSRELALSFAGLAGVLLGIALLTPLATILVVEAVRPLLSRTIGILGAMAARGVTQTLSRTAPAVASLVVAVSVTVGLGIMISSFRSTVVRWLDYTLQADVYVSPPSLVSSRAEGELPAELVARLIGWEGVDGASTYRGIEIEAPSGPASLIALELDPRGEASFGFLEGDRDRAFAAFRAGTGALISEPFAFRNSLSVGDTVRIPSDRGELALPVEAVFTDYGSERGVVMVGRVAYDRAFDDDAVTSLGIFLAEGVDVDEAVAALEARVGEGETAVIRSNRTLRDGSLEVFDRTFAITGVLRALAFVVAFIGVLSALMALQLERARELGVLRANGLTPGQVWGLVTAQTGLLGTVAGLLAMPAGVILAVIMIFVVNRRSFGWTLQMELGPGVFLQALALAVVGALLAGLWPAWRMSRTSPAVALRDE